MVCYRGENRLLINNGAYRPFKDATAVAGLSGNLRPGGVYNRELGTTIYDIKLGTTLFDFDNDGDGDVMISGWKISTSFYRNEASLSFTNMTERLDIFPPINANGCFACDINNDGFDDLLIGSGNFQWETVTTGKVSVILGRASGWRTGINLSNSTFINVSYIGEDSAERIGIVSGAGDVNNDTYDDFIVGVPSNGEGGGDAGASP